MVQDGAVSLCLFHGKSMPTTLHAMISPRGRSTPPPKSTNLPRTANGGHPQPYADQDGDEVCDVDDGHDNRGDDYCRDEEQGR